MSMSAKANMDNLLPTESHQLCEQKILKIHVAMEALLSRAGKILTTKRSQFHMPLNTAREAAITWSDADRRKANWAIGAQNPSSDTW